MENRSIHDDVWLAPWDPEWAHKHHMEKQSIVGSMMAEFAWADIIVSVFTLVLDRYSRPV